MWIKREECITIEKKEQETGKTQTNTYIHVGVIRMAYA